MARQRTSEAELPKVNNCDLCHERKGRNATAVHILKFRDEDELARHLQAVFPETKYCVEFFTNFWITARRIYATVAKEKYVPLWLVYLEAHGVKIDNRAEAIIRYRSNQLA